ncbi:MAG: alpha/beta hydrolase [Lachnospiraceae bacterium]|nr:alpha/beta hydrolase [Lachnospiraceae bacterium]
MEENRVQGQIQHQKRAGMVEMSDGAYLYTELWGEEKQEGITLVCIPGFCCTTSFFENNVPRLSKTHPVLVYDPRGQGNSSKGLQGHTVARNAADLKELLEHFKIKQAVVIAWSMAGQFIMEYVHAYGEENLAGIVLADCPLHAMGEEPWNAHGLKGSNMDHFNAHLCRSYNHWEEYCRDFAVKIWGGIDEGRIDWAAAEFTKTPPWIAFAIYSDMVYRNSYPYLEQTTVPMLFTGANSRVTENGIELARKWYPGARKAGLVTKVCTFDKGGHVFFHQESEKFNAAVLSFVKNLKGARRH